MKNEVYIPNLDAIQRFYAFLLIEIEDAGYSSEERSMLWDPHLYYGRYLNPELRNYFIQTVIPHIENAVTFFELTEAPHKSILDLGCGLGMQSLIFASMGAKVVAIDIKGDSIALCKRRKVYYERQLNMDLNIEFLHRDFRLSKKSDFGTVFNGIFSMSAFSYINPLERTVSLISSILKDDAKVFLYEKNTACLLNFFKGREVIPSPASTFEAFKREKFSLNFIHGGCSLPSFLWRNQKLNRSLLHPLNGLLRKSLYLSFNYVLGMERGSAD